MAEENPAPPKISVSRTSTGSNKNQPNTSDAQNTFQPSNRGFTYNTWKPPPWRSNFGAQAWKHHVHDPDLKWHIPWKKDCFATGRVLIIDYVGKDSDAAADRGRKRHISVLAQEFENLKSLQEFYSNDKRASGAALRVIHLQNCAWATGFFLRKFNIESSTEGMPGFSKWCKYTGPRQRNNKPFPSGRTWREQTDPWRGVSSTAFGLDYLKTFDTPDPRKQKPTVFGDKPLDAHMLHLDAYDDDRNPHEFDVSVQRLNVYIQRNLGPTRPVSPDDQKKDPYRRHDLNGHWKKGDEDKIDIGCLDNTSTVIIFETSASMSTEDCLIQPRNELESRWRRLPFYLRKQDIRDDTRLAQQCANMVLSDVFHALAISWQEFLARGQDHVTILEEKIYDSPADESRAPELWSNQAAWLKVDKVMFLHQDLIREMQGHLHDLSEVEIDEDGAESDSQSRLQIEWLSSVGPEYERLAHGVQEDLLQPTANLNDLMYKSVGIRDSRQSLQLGLSMWRLSWITFIFLPLTFIVSFFGMNVDIFAGEDGDAYPNVGWYFLAAFILMIFVLLLWYCVKHSLQRRRQSQFQRGLYEEFFTKLQDKYPNIWTSGGAVNDLQPDGFTNKIKWRLLRRWFAPERTINQRMYQSLVPDGDEDADFGTWDHIKKRLLKRWLPMIRFQNQAGDDVPMADVEQAISTSAPASLRYESGVVTKLAKASTPIAIAEAEPSAVQQMTTVTLDPLNAHLDTAGRRRSSVDSGFRRQSEDRPSSRRSSGVMFEERAFSDSESDVGGGAPSSQGRPNGRRASE